MEQHCRSLEQSSGPMTEVEEMIRVHHIAFMDMLSTTEQLSDVRQQILAASAAFYAAKREEVARKGGN